MCVCSVVYALSRKFSPFSLSKRYYIVQYRRKNTFSCRRDCQLLCCHSVLLLWRFIFLHHVLQVFQSTFSPVTVQLRRAATDCATLMPSSQVCVALMVSAPFIVGINTDVSFRNYYNSHLSHLFSKASVTNTITLQLASILPKFCAYLPAYSLLHSSSNTYIFTALMG